MAWKPLQVGMFSTSAPTPIGYARPQAASIFISTQREPSAIAFAYLAQAWMYGLTEALSSPLARVLTGELTTQMASMTCGGFLRGLEPISWPERLEPWEQANQIALAKRQSRSTSRPTYSAPQPG